MAQKVKNLRKRKGLSQEDLAKNSGLSLRTIQRVENGETEPTGETLKRISAVLDVDVDELVDWDTNDPLKHSVKTRYEYLHIFENKLVISKTEHINDLVEDYSESVNNVFKTLMVFFIFIPVFTTMAVIFYNMGKNGLSIYAGSNAFLFLIVAFYTILFTSGSSLIKVENIDKIVMKKMGFYTAVVITHRESGRLKERSLLIEKDQINIMKSTLLSEKLLDENNIKLKNNLFSVQTILPTATVTAVVFGIIVMKMKIDQMMFYYGAITASASIPLIIKMTRRMICSSGKKQHTVGRMCH